MARTCKADPEGDGRDRRIITLEVLHRTLDTALVYELKCRLPKRRLERPAEVAEKNSEEISQLVDPDGLSEIGIDIGRDTPDAPGGEPPCPDIGANLSVPADQVACSANDIVSQYVASSAPSIALNRGISVSIAETSLSSRLVTAGISNFS
jgi:hypothetical protein